MMGSASRGMQEGVKVARSEARIKVTIWKDRDYRELSHGAQWLFECLISQPDMTNAGVVPLRVSRWARLASDLNDATVEKYLAELVERRYVVADRVTGEALVRSFMRNDEVWKQPNVLRSAQRAVDDIESESIAAALLPEVELMLKLEGVTERVQQQLEDMMQTLQGRLLDTPAEPSAEPLVNPSPNPSAKGSANPKAKGGAKAKGEGGVVTEVSKDSPLLLPPDPRPSAAASATAEQPLTEGQRAKRITDAYHAAEPMCKWPAVNSVVRKAISIGKHTDDEIQAALLRLASEGRSVTVETLRVELQGLPPSRYGAPAQRGVYRDPADQDAYDSWTKGPTR